MISASRPSFEDDKQLWNAFKNGSREAFAEIYDRYYQALYHYGFKLAGDASVVEDTIQDLFIDLWRMQKNLAEIENGSIKYYLYRVLRRRIHRYLTSDLLLQNDVEEGEFLEALTPESAIIEQEIYEEHLQKLRKAIDLLPARQSEAIALRYYEEFSVREIAVIMTISEQTVRNMIQQALEKLRKYIVSAALLLFFFFLNQ